MIFSSKKEENYFEMFKVLSAYACDAAQKIDRLISDYTNVEAKCREIEDLEHTADKHVQKIYSQLNHSFITPIDREDIFLIAKRLDQVCDQIDSAAQRFLMYDVQDMTDEAKGFARLIIKSCNYLGDIVAELKHFKKAEKIHQGIALVNEIEHEGDDHYHASVRRLYQSGRDTLYVMKWNKMYQALENILDSCEDVANTILSVVVKNS